MSDHDAGLPPAWGPSPVYPVFSEAARLRFEAAICAESVVPFRVQQRWPSLGFLGHSGSGKDEAGNWLAAHTPLRFVHSSSWYLAPHVTRLRGIPTDVLRGPGRHAHRVAMWDVGNEIRAGDPGFLIRELLAENDVVVGLRDVEEVEHARAHGIVDLFYWIDRDVPPDPTMAGFGDTPWKHADLRLDNTGTLAEFHARLGRLVRALGIPTH